MTLNIISSSYEPSIYALIDNTEAYRILNPAKYNLKTEKFVQYRINNIKYLPVHIKNVKFTMESPKNISIDKIVFVFKNQKHLSRVLRWKTSEELAKLYNPIAGVGPQYFTDFAKKELKSCYSQGYEGYCRLSQENKKFYANQTIESDDTKIPELIAVRVFDKYTGTHIEHEVFDAIQNVLVHEISCELDK